MSRSPLTLPLSDRTIAALTAALFVAGLSGCTTKPPMEPPATAPTADQVQMLRESYRTAFPMARVGVVSVVLSDDPYAMVTDIDTTGIKDGDYISFVDGQQTVVAGGKVINVSAGGVAVMFEPAVRSPIIGDAAVKF